MNPKERMLFEAVQNMLKDKTSYGLDFHKGNVEDSHHAQFRHQDIEKTFKIKVNQPNVNMYEYVCAAFHHTHSYRNIDDPKFDLAFQKQMGKIVPKTDQAIAFKVLNDMRKEFSPKAPGGDIEDRNTIGDLEDMRTAMGNDK